MVVDGCCVVRGFRGLEGQRCVEALGFVLAHLSRFFRPPTKQWRLTGSVAFLQWLQWHDDCHRYFTRMRAQV